MPDKFTHFGEFFMQGLAKTLAEGIVVHVPHVGACTVSHVSESRLLQSSWSMRNWAFLFPCRNAKPRECGVAQDENVTFILWAS